MKLDSKDHGWMRSNAIAAIFEALPENSLRFVGGCVRNALMGVPVGDVDLATQLEPNLVAEALDKAGIRYVPTGIEHGTLTAVIGKIPFEITSLRKDVETDGRRAVVAYTQDWAEDAQRRDLTINALYADYDGQIYDPTGQGLDDIQAKKFRFVGKADQRVKEDYLRILRFFRFLAYYGGAEKVDAASLRACRENRAGLKKLSAERVWMEVKKLLSAPDPVRACRIMLTNEILDVVLPEASNVEGLECLVALEKAEGWTVDPLLRLMSMAARDALSMARLCKRLRLSNKEAVRLRGWAEDDAQLSADMSERDLLAAIYNSGKQVITDRAHLRAAGSEDNRQPWLSIANTAQDWEVPSFPLTGADMKQAGVASGPEMGRALKALEALWVRSGFKTEKPQLLAALKMLGH